MLIEHDLTSGGHPILRIERGTELRDPLCYLSVSVAVQGCASVIDKSVFLGLSRTDWAQLRDAINDMMEALDAVG